MSAPPDAFPSRAPVHEWRDGDGAGDLPTTLRRVAAHVVAQVHTRLELLQVELALEQLRLRGFVMFGALAMFFAFVALALVVLFIIAAAWDTQWRLPVIGLLAAAAVGGMIFCAMALKQRKQALTHPFETSLAELAKDRRALEEGL